MSNDTPQCVLERVLSTKVGGVPVAIRLGLVVGRLRGLLPMPAVRLLVALRTHLAWRQEKVREDAVTQMSLLLGETDPTADLEAAARRYVRRQAWRGELRWHQQVISSPRIEGLEHLRAAQAQGRGVLVNYLHHGHWEGWMAALDPHAHPLHVMAFPKLLDTRLLPAWLQQHARICSDAGNIGVPADAGFETFVQILKEGHVLTAAFDLPGRTPAGFVGRDLLASFGAPRMAFATGSPVVVATSELSGSDPVPLVRLHEPIDPADFETPQALMERLLEIHQTYVTRWPELYDIPTSHWAVPSAAADTPTSAARGASR